MKKVSMKSSTKWSVNSRTTPKKGNVGVSSKKNNIVMRVKPDFGPEDHVRGPKLKVKSGTITAPKPTLIGSKKKVMVRKMKGVNLTTRYM